LSAPSTETPTTELPGGGLGYALNRAAHLWRAELADVLADVSVTPSQFFVLAALLHSHRTGRQVRQRAVAEQAGTDANTASQIVRGLERRGLVRRQADPTDARALALTLTGSGLELATLCAARARALNTDFFAGADAPSLYRALSELAKRA
jgi:DNA-binding MarR family transcriptional regulator